MNKKEMAAELARQVGISEAKAAEAISAIFDPGRGIIAVELSAKGAVRIPGFGTFLMKHRAARTGTNPATGAKISIGARTIPAFRSGKTLNERVASDDGIPDPDKGIGISQ